MRTKVITVCIFFELLGLVCLIAAVLTYMFQGEPAVVPGITEAAFLNLGMSWKLVVVGLVCAIPAIIYMAVFSWWSAKKRGEQVSRLMAGEDPNVVLQGVPRDEVEKIMDNIRIIRESQARDRVAQEEESRRLELEIKQMDEMLRRQQALMAEEYRKTNAEAMLAQQEYLKKQAEEMSRTYEKAFKEQQEELMRQNSPNYRKADTTINVAVAVPPNSRSHETVTHEATYSSASFSDFSDPLLSSPATTAAESALIGRSVPEEETPAMPVAPKEEYDKIMSEQVEELTTARDSYAEMTHEQLEELARALAEDVIRDSGFMSPQDVEVLIKKHKDELEEQKNAYSELTGDKIQALAHERAVEALRAQGYMSPTQVNELLETQKATQVAEMMSQEQIEELAHKRALEIANEKVAATKEDMEALALEMARQSTQQQIAQIEAEKARLEDEKRLLDQKTKETDAFAKQQLESALLGKGQMEILQAEHQRVETRLREKELKEQVRIAKQQVYRENRLQAELARKQQLSRPNIEKLIGKYFGEVAVCFFLDREEYKRKYGISPYNRVVMQPATKKGTEPTAKYIMACTEDRLFRFAEVLVDVEKFFLHPQLYSMYNDLLNARTPLVLVSERLHHMYLQFHRKDFVRDYRHKPNFDNLLIVVSNHFAMRAIDFKALFPTPYPFDINNYDDDTLVEYFSDADRQKTFEQAFPHYYQMGFENLYQAMYLGFIQSIKERLQPEDLVSVILKDTARITKLMYRQESAKGTKRRTSESGTKADETKPKKTKKSGKSGEPLAETIDDIFDKVPEEKPVEALKDLIQDMPEDTPENLPVATHDLFATDGDAVTDVPLVKVSSSEEPLSDASAVSNASSASDVPDDDDSTTPSADADATQPADDDDGDAPIYVIEETTW